MVLLVPDYFALHNAPPYGALLSKETPPVSFTYRYLLNLFLIFIRFSSSEARLGTPIE